MRMDELMMKAAKEVMKGCPDANASTTNPLPSNPSNGKRGFDTEGGLSGART